MTTLDGLMNVIRRLNPLRNRRSMATQADQQRGEHIRGQGFMQTADEQAGTRQRMEAELNSQRQQRAAGQGSNAVGEKV
jgi:hypothetical protein